MHFMIKSIAMVKVYVQGQCVSLYVNFACNMNAIIHKATTNIDNLYNNGTMLNGHGNRNEPKSKVSFV